MLGTTSGQAVEGNLRILLATAGGQVDSVSIESSRPLTITKLFESKTPDEVARLLPLLYRICGVAQGCAAANALERTMSVSASDAISQGRQLLVWCETLREHLWRIELDWAKLLGRPAHHETIALAGRMLESFRHAMFGERNPFLPGYAEPVSFSPQLLDSLADLHELLQERVFGIVPGDWLEMSDERMLESWAARQQTTAACMVHTIRRSGLAGFGASPVSPLPNLGWELLEQRFRADGEAFVSRPDWAGVAGETGAFARQSGQPLVQNLIASWGSGLLPRLVARLSELAVTLGAMREASGGRYGQMETGGRHWSPGPGVGLSQVETSRGRLIHRAEVRDGRVVRYQILAPTEWNFHPRGVIAQGLEGCESKDPDSLLHNASLLVNAVDPCVSYWLEIVAAGS